MTRPLRQPPGSDNLSASREVSSLPLQRRDAMSAQFSALNLRPLLRDGQKGLFYLSLTGRRDADSVGKKNRFVLDDGPGPDHKTSAQAEVRSMPSAWPNLKRAAM